MSDPTAATSPPRWLRLVGSFGTFWVVALVSQSAASTLSACAAWFLGSPSLPTWVPLLNSGAALGGGLVGSVLAGRSVFVRDLARTIGACAVLQTAVSAAVALLALPWRGDVGAATVGVLVTANALSALCLGVAGPAWLVLVGRWPGERRSGPGRLMLESSQFQLANFIGPLVAGVLLSSTLSPVVVAGSFDALSWLLLVGYMRLVRRLPAYPDVHEEAEPERSRTGSVRGRPGRTAWPLVALVALAVAVDAPRAYLSRLMQEAGSSASDFSLTMAVTAISAAAAGIAGSLLVRRVGTSRLLLVGFGLALAGLLCWAVRDPWSWIVGGAGIGAGTAVASATITAHLVESAPGASAASALATAGVLRRLAGTAGGLGIVALFAGPGMVPLLPSLLAAVVGGAVVVGRVGSVGPRQRVGRVDRQ